MIDWALDALRILVTPERLIALLSTVFSGWLGYALLFGIVFAETGLLLGFMLPGDSLLFTVGVVAGAGQLDLLLINVVLIAAAFIGDAVGYALGHRAGIAIFTRPDSRFFKREHLVRTRKFYEKHGGKTIIYARFLPIIRTFAPFIAGVVGMGYARFAAFNIFGAVGWVVLFTVLGYELGSWPIVRAHFEKVVFAIIVISLLPAVFEAVKSRQASRQDA